MDISGLFDLWDTNKGLWIFFGLWTVLFISVFALNELPLITRLVLPGIVLFIYYFAWKRRRSPSILFKRSNVVFAFYSASETPQIDEFLKNFQTRFSQNFRSHNLDKQVNLVFLPKDKEIKNSREAEKLVQNGYVGHTILIWGNLETFSGNVSCRTTFFSYEFAFQRYFPKMSAEDIKRIFKNEIDKINLKLLWDSKNLNIEKQFSNYFENIYDVGLYTLALTLLTVGEDQKSVKTLESIIFSMNSLNPIEKYKRLGILAEINRLLSNIYLGQAMPYRFDHTDIGEEKVRLAVSYDPHSYAANLMYAYFLEKNMKDESLVRKHLAEASRFARTRQNDHYFSLAYLDLKNEKFDDALKIYKMLEKYDMHNINFLDIATFFDDAYKNTKKLQYLFAKGLIRFNWYNDPKEGVKELKHFLRLSEQQNDKYLPLREEARGKLVSIK